MIVKRKADWIRTVRRFLNSIGEKKSSINSHKKHSIGTHPGHGFSQKKKSQRVGAEIHRTVDPWVSVFFELILVLNTFAEITQFCRQINTCEGVTYGEAKGCPH